MDHKIAAFLQKNAVSPGDIKYILREDGKTNVYLLNGKMVSTYHPIKDFRAYLPVEHFLCPNKGILLAESQIRDIQNGCYLTADGRSFKYRVHNSQMHDTRLLSLGRSMEQPASPAPHVGAESYRCLDKLPMAVCVFEYVPKSHGFGADFIIRYCNKELLSFEGLNADDILGHSVTEIFPYTNPKWLVAYADVALNDTVRTVDEYSNTKGQWIHVYCHQPEPHHCMCTLIPHPGHLELDSQDGETKVGLMYAHFY